MNELMRMDHLFATVNYLHEIYTATCYATFVKNYLCLKIFIANNGIFF